MTIFHRWRRCPDCDGRLRERKHAIDICRACDGIGGHWEREDVPCVQIWAGHIEVDHGVLIRPTGEWSMLAEALQPGNSPVPLTTAPGGLTPFSAVAPS